MFTGIIETISKVRAISSRSGLKTLELQWPIVEKPQIGGSIAVNGVCLTITSIKPGAITADIVRETLNRTNLGELRTGDPVNLERPLTLQKELGGHIIQGHIDEVLKISFLRKLEGEHRLGFKIPDEYRDLVVPKGFIAVDGISLTVAGLQGQDVELAVIPHTFRNTILQYKRTGQGVNIEFDILGKYVNSYCRNTNKA
ncbi:riboflavin synthase [bacterium]|nr:riboflavin synthase [bacterium]